MASINYLRINRGAVIAYKRREIKSKLNSLINSPDLRRKYANKAWACGQKNHQIKIIQNNLLNDLECLIYEK